MLLLQLQLGGAARRFQRLGGDHGGRDDAAGSAGGAAVAVETGAATGSGAMMQMTLLAVMRRQRWSGGTMQKAGRRHGVDEHGRRARSTSSRARPTRTAETGEHSAG